MIKYTATRPDKEVNTAAQRSCLIIDIDSTVDRERIELIRVMFELLQFVLHLNCELSGRAENDGLNLMLA